MDRIMTVEAFPPLYIVYWFRTCRLRLIALGKIEVLGTSYIVLYENNVLEIHFSTYFISFANNSQKAILSNMV